MNCMRGMMKKEIEEIERLTDTIDERITACYQHIPLRTKLSVSAYTVLERMESSTQWIRVDANFLRTIDWHISKEGNNGTRNSRD